MILNLVFSLSKQEAEQETLFFKLNVVSLLRKKTLCQSLMNYESYLNITSISYSVRITRHGLLDQTSRR